MMMRLQQRSAMVVVGASLLAAARHLDLVMLDQRTFPDAMCNDGTMGGYYFRPSASGGSSLWIVHQQGGGWCWDEDSCAARPQSLRSSSGWESSLDMYGLLDADDPRLADANVVYVPYCSSDAWVGSAPSSSVGFPFTFHMLGRRIITAVFTDLIATQGMGSGGASTGVDVLYSGCSAGARGVLFNNEYIAGLLPTLLQQASHRGARLGNFGALLDSAFWLDIAPMSGTPAISFAHQVQSIFQLANVSATSGPTALNPACRAAFPAIDGWKCLMGVR